MAARSDEPANRCERPQSLSTSAAGRRLASTSAKTSMAADRRAAGVMGGPRERPRPYLDLFLRAGHAAGSLRTRDLMSAHLLAQILERLSKVMDVDTFRTV